ncbi:uncharacterized protein TNCV_101801 [Trichonephila clavipes]|nr:uncharacterized protein TNCV_101801 [Trichonephila clavipes]
MTDVNQEPPRFALSVNAESFVPKEDETQIVATACFKNKCLLSTALILVKDKYSEWQTFRALLDSGTDSKFNVPGKIDLLLGANIFYELLKPERIKIKDSQLLLVNSVFGYIVTGNLDSINETKVHCGLIRDEDLNKNLEKFWKLEEIEEPIVKNKERLICEEHYANTHFRTKEGKYVVSMPLKKEPSCLGNSKDIALKRLGSLWNRLARDKNYLNLYREFLRDYERLGHMKEVTNETEPKVAYYATHHGIYRPEKPTTKLRVVFNCSSLTDNGISLNDIQYNGGVIQEDLYAQMLRFRTYTYAFTADIKMMYRTILINPKQRNLQRIVWCESEHESPKIYEFSTVIYGAVSAPYLAQRTLTQLSMDEEANFPIAAYVLRNNLYMDDVLCGAETLEEAIVLRQQLKGILNSAGIELHKLCANHEKLSPDPEQNYNFATLTETKTLGVSWKPNLDCFLIKVNVCLDSSYTKRDVLSTIAKIFDPVGLMAPVISKAKIFLQRLWRSKLEWNDLLPAEEYREWQQFLVSLENINNIEIPRRILVAFPEVIEIHGFADASERCYGAAVYCKSKNLKSETLVRLITSKSRVAPIKSLTIPRLELCAAVLLAKLVKRVVAALQLETAELYLWSDSMIVLAWLRKEPMDLKTFVQNRVAKIQELYPNQLWRHVLSDQNPADLVSRGVDPDKLLQQNLWFNGPTFLSGDDYPNRTINCREKLDEYNSELKNCVNEQIENFQSVLNIHVNDFLNDLLNLSNNYITILRVLSFIFRFVENLKGINKVAGPLTTKEFKKAETYLVKKVQKQEFSSDINHLKSKGSVLPNSKLKTLNPFLDDNGVLRRDNQTVQRSVLNPLADVFGGPGGSNCVVPPQGENEENKSFAVLLSSVNVFLRDKYGLYMRDVVRFVIDDGENGVQVYRFNRVLFGVNASPFLLAATIKTHIGKYMETYPDTVRTLDHCFYVDDLVTGEDDAKSAFDLSSKAAKIMSEAGMNLRKWISNDCELMKQWQLEHFDHLNMNDFVNHPHRVLGILWHPQKTISVFV